MKTNQLMRYELIVSELKKGNIIEFGSGTGDLNKYLKRSGDVIGVDIIDSDNTDIIHNLNKFPYPIKSNYADNIVAGEIIEHLKNPLEFLIECNRILKSDGRLIITTPNMTGLQYLLNIWKNTEESNLNHLYAWNQELFNELAKTTKFKISKKRLITTMWNRNILCRLICFMIPNIRTTMFFVLEKDRKTWKNE